MSRPLAVGLLLVLWALTFGWSVLGAALMAPEGDGFTRGLNRVAHLLGWQAGAAALAVTVWGIGARLPRGTWLRRIARLPVLIAALVLLACIALLGWGVFGPDGMPPQQASPGTAPAPVPSR